MPQSLTLAVAAVIATLAVACGSSDSVPYRPTSEVSSDDAPPVAGSVRETATPGTTVFPTRRAGTPAPSSQRTPGATAVVATPTVTPVTITQLYGNTRLVASMSGSCRAVEVGAEITINVRVMIQGDGQISRIRLLLDSQDVEDTGPTPDREVNRTATVKVPNGTRHHAQLLAEANSIMRNAANLSISCP